MLISKKAEGMLEKIKNDNIGLGLLSWIYTSDKGVKREMVYEYFRDPKNLLDKHLDDLVRFGYMQELNYYLIVSKEGEEIIGFLGSGMAVDDE